MHRWDPNAGKTGLMKGKEIGTFQIARLDYNRAGIGTWEVVV